MTTNPWLVLALAVGLPLFGAWVVMLIAMATEDWDLDALDCPDEVEAP